MSYGFWKDIKLPAVVLAPLADVTDPAFRRIIAKYGKPDVMWTEFVSADGLSHPEAREKLMLDLRYVEEERPIIAQLFSSNIDEMKKAVEIACELGFDGIDINMGCPDKNVCKQGAGSALIRTPEKAQEIIRASKEVAGDIPVSVKTRIGYSKDEELEYWLASLLETEPALITLHARTKKNMSKVPARWETISEAVRIRDEAGSKTLIFGNGDVKNIEEAHKRVEETGCDGVMIGRGIFGNPWLWSGHVPTKEEKLRVLVEHTNLFAELMPYKSFAIMKKHFKAYVTGWDGAKELRMQLMEANTADAVEKVVADYLEGQ